MKRSLWRIMSTHPEYIQCSITIPGEINVCPWDIKLPLFDIVFAHNAIFSFWDSTYQHSSLRQNAIFTYVTLRTSWNEVLVCSTRNNHIDPSYTNTVEKVLRHVLQHCLSLINPRRDHIQTKAPSGQTSTTIWLVNEHCDCRYWMLYTTVSKNGGVFSR